MVKLMKKKILVCLISIVMVTLVVGNIYSLATDGASGGGTLTLTETNKNSTNQTGNNSTGNSSADLEAEVGATNSNTNSNKNTNTANKSSNNTANNANSSRYNNTNSAKSGLPYAGSNTSIIFIVIALVASAAYAYKKISDYNV